MARRLGHSRFLSLLIGALTVGGAIACTLVFALARPTQALALGAGLWLAAMVVGSTLEMTIRARRGSDLPRSSRVATVLRMSGAATALAGAALLATAALAS